MEGTSEEYGEPGSEEVEDHREVGCDDCDKGLARAPGVGNLGAVQRLLVCVRDDLLGEISWTYRDEKDALESGADENKHTGAQHDGRCDLLDELQARFPQHGNWDEDEVRIGDDVGDERHPDDGLGNSGLTDVYM